MMEIIKDIYYVGVDDHQIDLFEGQYRVPNGMSYNSYVIMDDKIAILDTVDFKCKDEWLNNIRSILKDKLPDYLVVQHMESDHSANIMSLLEIYPDITIVGNALTFKMINQFFDVKIKNKIVVKEYDILNLGSHKLNFVFAPMVHWPEVMMSYDEKSKAFFSADAFGKFGALDCKDDWVTEARRYYIGIVGKYGRQVQDLFKKISSLEVETILPLHGPMILHDIKKFINYYNIWSSYKPEKDGIVIAYCSIYGHTKAAVHRLVKELISQGYTEVSCYDLARTDLSLVVSEAFKYSKLVLATPTYNSGVFPFMQDFLTRLKERNFKNRTIGIIENGSWAPLANKVIRLELADNDLNYLEPVVTINSKLNEASEALIRSLCMELIK